MRSNDALFRSAAQLPRVCADLGAAYAEAPGCPGFVIRVPDEDTSGPEKTTSIPAVQVHLVVYAPSDESLRSSALQAETAIPRSKSKHQAGAKRELEADNVAHLTASSAQCLHAVAAMLHTLDVA
jgi:hypothetical protein